MANNKGTIEDLVRKGEIDQLRDKIEKACGKLNVPFELSDPIESESDEWVAFPVTPKRSSTISRLRDRLPDIGDRVGRDMYLEGRDHQYFLVIPDRNVEPASFKDALHNYIDELNSMKLPCVAGCDVFNHLILYDLAEAPHVLLGGSSGSGKSIGLKLLISTICRAKWPNEADFILVDVGASDLTVFNGLPHLSCPVITTFDSAYRALLYIRDEMERRIKLKGAEPSKFGSLPSLVLVIDEFPALIQMGEAAGKLKELTAVISSMLQRGRHAKLHLVLSAQNPTMQSMRVDLSNITTRIAFKCAKKNYSETILGEPGAERLRGKGDLLLKAPQFDTLKRLQGLYVSPDDLHQMINHLKSANLPSDCQFIIPDEVLVADVENSPVDIASLCPPVCPKVSPEELQLSNIILWAFKREQVSTNALLLEFHYGWPKADKLISQLERLGIVSTLKGKSARVVIPTELGDLPPELISLLESAGITESDISRAFANRRDSSDISVR